MNSHCKEFVYYIVNTAPKHNKFVLQNDVIQKFKLTKDRTVYRNDYFAVRFCYSKKDSDSFSNTVFLLSALEKYDKIPFFVVLVRKNKDNLILLANSSFLKKISHSSKELQINNIRGSFNGSDIFRKYNNLNNAPENFDSLFSIHKGFDWEDNLERLVDASSNIRPKNVKFDTSDTESIIADSIDRSIKFIQSKSYIELKKDLDERCGKCKNEILIASHIENVNIRGRLIESLITYNDNERDALIRNLHNKESDLPIFNTKNGLADYTRIFNDFDSYTDIKTKIIYLDSNPKAFNIDKFLKQMSDPRSVFLFYFIGINENETISTILCSVYHDQLIECTILQHHWSGRSNRGVAQFSGKTINQMIGQKDFTNHINYDLALNFLQTLINR